MTTQTMIVSRTFAIVWANEIRDPWERASRLFNLGIKGGTTREQVRWFLANGTFA